MERNVKLTVQYDGTRFAGFQVQPNGLTVQELLTAAVVHVTGEQPRRWAAAGRTDAGVHARGQVVSYCTATRIPTERLPYALNSRLPGDVAVMAAEAVPDSFHARFSARGKVYRYTVDTGPIASPLERCYAYHVPRALNREAMTAAGRLLVGRHDFAAFRSTGGAARTTQRHVFRLEVAATGHLLHITAEADGFLYNMMRIIAGTLVEVGLGKIGPERVAEALATGRRERAGKTLPAHGLCLERVLYEGGAEEDAHR